MGFIRNLVAKNPQHAPVTRFFLLIRTKCTKVLELFALQTKELRSAWLAWQVRRNAQPPERVIWLLSAGRSGSTWISNLLNASLHYREVFEPFHAVHCDMPKAPTSHPYNPVSKEFEAYADAVFEGRYANARTEFENLGKRRSRKGLIVKDVYANLFCEQELAKRDNVCAILLIRNPADVVASKLTQRHWHWVWDPEEFLNDPRLVSAHLAPFIPVIREAARGECMDERLLTTWCIQHLVPLRACPPNRLQLVFYEDVRANPQREIQRLLAAAGVEFSREAADAISALAPKPSRLARVRSDEKPLPPQEVVERVFSRFGLSDWLSRGRIDPEGVRSWWWQQHPFAPGGSHEAERAHNRSK